MHALCYSCSGPGTQDVGGEWQGQVSAINRLITRNFRKLEGVVHAGTAQAGVTMRDAEARMEAHAKAEAVGVKQAVTERLGEFERGPIADHHRTIVALRDELTTWKAEVARLMASAPRSQAHTVQLQSPRVDADA